MGSSVFRLMGACFLAFALVALLAYMLFFPYDGESKPVDDRDYRNWLQEVERDDMELDREEEFKKTLWQVG